MFLPWSCSLYSTLSCPVLPALELLTVKYSVLPYSVRLGIAHCTVLCSALELLTVQYSVLPRSARLGVAHCTVLRPTLFCSPWSCSLFSTLFCRVLPWCCSSYSTLSCLVLPALEMLNVQYSVLSCSARLGVAHCTVLCPALICLGVAHLTVLCSALFCPPWSCSL